MPPVDISTVLEQLPKTQAALSSAANTFTDAAATVSAVGGTQNTALQGNIPLIQEVSTQKGTGELQSQTDTRNVANIMMGGIDDPANLQVQLAQSVHDEATKALAARQVLSDNAVQEAANPWARVTNIFSNWKAERADEEHTQNAQESLTQFSAINNATTAASTTNDKIAEVQTTKTVADTAQILANNASNLASEAQVKMLVSNADLVAHAATFSNEQFGNLDKALTLQQNIADHKMMYDLKAEDEASIQGMMKIYNVGAVGMGKPLIESAAQWKLMSKIPGMSVQMGALLNYGANAIGNGPRTLPDGTVVPSTGAASLAESGGQALVTSRLISAQPGKSETRVYALRDDLMKQVSELHGGAVVKPDQYVDGMNGELETLGKKLSTNIESIPFAKNPFMSPGTSTISTLSPQLAALPEFKAIFDNLSAAGQDVPTADVVMASAINAINKGSDFNRTAAVVANYYNMAKYSNANFGGNNKYALPQVAGYNVQLSNPSMLGVLGHQRVDMTKQNEVRDYIMRNWKTDKSLSLLPDTMRAPSTGMGSVIPGLMR